jgi:hypothetical protein
MVPNQPIDHRLVELRYMQRPTITIKLDDHLRGQERPLQSRIQAVLPGVRFLPDDGVSLQVVLASSSQYDAAYQNIRRILVALLSELRA